MKILVSSSVSRNDFPGYLVSSSLSEALTTVGSNNLSVDLLVVHDPSDDPLSLVPMLTRFHATFPQSEIAYVRGPELRDAPVSVTVEGLGGRYLDDEFFVRDEATLNQALRSDMVTSLDRVSSDITILKSFLDDSSNGQSIPVARRALVDSSLSSITAELDRLQDEKDEMSGTAVRIFDQMFLLQQDLKRTISDLKDHLTSARSALASQTMSADSASFSNITYFPQVRVDTGKMVVRIKDIGGMPFLTSFAMGLANYYRTHHNKRPRVVFLESVGEVPRLHYRHLPWIESSTDFSDPTFSEPVVFTNHPTEKVVHALVGNSKFDSLIVVDRLASSRSHLMVTPKNNVLYAIPGISVATSNNIPLNRCIVAALDSVDVVTSVPLFPTYPSSEPLRVSTYSKIDKTYAAVDHYMKS